MKFEDEKFLVVGVCVIKVVLFLLPIVALTWVIGMAVWIWKGMS